MSIRLNKIGNISQALPYTTSSSYDFGSAPRAYIQSDSRVYPFFGGSLMGKQFRAYKHGILGAHGSTLAFAGGGTYAFRADKGDYFLAGFDLSPLFDAERETPALLGLSSQCNVVTESTQKLPQIFPMFIWTPVSSTAGQKSITSFCCVAPSFVARFTAGVSNNVVTLENQFEISNRVNNVVHEVYFAWFMGQAYPNIQDDSKIKFPATTVKDLTISLNAATLKGNRPVFDPVVT